MRFRRMGKENFEPETELTSCSQKLSTGKAEFRNSQTCCENLEGYALLIMIRLEQFEHLAHDHCLLSCQIRSCLTSVTPIGIERHRCEQANLSLYMDIQPE